MNEIHVALLGKDTEGWKSTTKTLVHSFLDEVASDEVRLRFKMSLPPEEMSGFPVSEVPYLRHVRHVQEQLLASMSNISVVPNDGSFTPGDVGVRKHWDRLSEKSQCLLFWTPPHIAEDCPSEDVVSQRPNVLPIFGDVERLCRVLAYLVIPSPEFLR